MLEWSIILLQQGDTRDVYHINWRIVVGEGFEGCYVNSIVDLTRFIRMIRISIFLMMVFVASSALMAQSENTLWYKKEAEHFEEALLLQGY